MPDHAYLDGHTVVPIEGDDVVEWARRFDRDNKHVAEDTVDGLYVSTVFLGINHAFSDNDPPDWFETMVFPEGSWSELWVERCSTWEEAEEMHKRGVEFAKGHSNA